MGEQCHERGCHETTLDGFTVCYLHVTKDALWLMVQCLRAEVESGRSKPRISRSPYKCPVCDGWGTREAARPVDNQASRPVTCNACNGTGVVWESALGREEKP